MRILVMGGGIAGISVALALSKELSPILRDLEITVFELRDVPSTSGGAVNLTPVAQRHLDQLGVLQELDRMGPDSGVGVNEVELFSMHSGRKIGSVDFAGKHGRGYGGYKGRRVMRISLHLAMMTALERRHNVDMQFGKKVIGAMETENGVTMHFADGTMESGDVVIGCDGVHSNTRTNVVDPTRLSRYTGISFIQATMPVATITKPFHFETTALNKSRRGALLTTFCDRQREELFVAALAEVSKQHISNHLMNAKDREYPRVKAKIVKALRGELISRFGKAQQPCIREILEKCPDWTLYPVYEVQPGGKWSTDRIILIGDAAHAMPPKDESAANALDDGIIFARVLARYLYEPLPRAFAAYEEIRRKPIEEAYKAASENFRSIRDSSGLMRRLEDWLTPWSLRRTRKIRAEAWMADAQTAPLPLPTTSGLGHEEFSDSESFASDYPPPTSFSKASQPPASPVSPSMSFSNASQRV